MRYVLSKVQGKKNQSASKEKNTTKKRRPKKKASSKKRIVKKVSKQQKIVRFFFNLLFYVVTIGFILGSGLFVLAQRNDQSLNGYRIFGVLSNSMVSPGNKIKPGGFRAGDILTIKETPVNEIKAGDVITYHPSSNPANKSTNYLTHRVVKVLDKLGDEEGTFFVTRGDANKTDDMPIAASQLVGKVTFSIPKFGGILAFIKENKLLSLMFVSCIWGFIFVMRVYIFSDSAKRTNRKRIQRRDITPKKRVNINKKNLRRTQK